MKIPRLLAFCSLVASSLATTAFAGGHDRVRNLNANLLTGGVRTVEVEAPVGEFRIEPGPAGEVSAQVEVHCDRPVEPRCRRKAEDITLEGRDDGDRISIDVDGWPKGGNHGLSLKVLVTMPRDLDLDAEFGVGEVVVRGLEGGITLELGVGEVSVEMPAPAARRVDLEVGVGEAILYVGGRRIEGKGFLGKEVGWSHGEGRSAVNVDCGVGEIEVRLTE